MNGVKASESDYKISDAHPTFTFFNEENGKFLFLNLTSLTKEKLGYVDYCRDDNDNPIVFSSLRFNSKVKEVVEKKHLLLYSVSEVDETFVNTDADFNTEFKFVTVEVRDSYKTKNFKGLTREVFKRILVDSESFYCYDGNPTKEKFDQYHSLSEDFIDCLKRKLKKKN